jgi:hypothetical protein
LRLTRTTHKTKLRDPAAGLPSAEPGAKGRKPNKGNPMSEEKKSVEKKIKDTKPLEAKSFETKASDIKTVELKTPDLTLHETKKPANLRANAMPTDGFVLAVDGKLKTRFENAKDALAAASKLKQTYPVIQVAIYDAIARIYTPVELQPQEA